MKIVIAGGGAAGFFAAANLIQYIPGSDIVVLEKSNKLLSKVRISGGGRCNVTHQCDNIADGVRAYPRGARELLSVFSRFSFNDTVQWFKNKGVDIKSENDGRMFPVTDNSQTIIDCLLKPVIDAGVEIKLNAEIIKVRRIVDMFEIILKSGDEICADVLLIAIGGNQNPEYYKWIHEIGHTIIHPIPSIFTFNIKDEGLRNLQGVSVPEARVGIEGSKLYSQGPLLITHWGISGPAILKLSAFAARDINNVNYQFNIQVSWVGLSDREKAKEIIEKNKNTFGSKPVDVPMFDDIPRRLWSYLVKRSGIKEELKLADLTKKNINSLAEILAADQYRVDGKTTFKEEFVTCGGVSLKEVDFRTMQSKLIPGLYFSGEVLDLDGITGGYNFQAAWATAKIASESIIERRQKDT